MPLSSVATSSDDHDDRVDQAEWFGGLVARSAAMCGAIASLRRAAGCDSTVLLDGETGTGKGEAAEALHRASARGGGPFVVVDCGAIPEALLESELFGHERGAFTGAVQRRTGAVEEAAGGTLFLDEIGELPLALQPKLLRVLESRTVRRIGGSATARLDIRIVAATHRDLRAEVAAGRFRADLFYRLAVLRIALPPLRERPDDLPVLAGAILERLGATRAQRAIVDDPRFVAQLAAAAWPGNVRELRNHLERCMIYGGVPPDDPVMTDDAGPLTALPLPAARDRAIAVFERRYLAELMGRHAGKVLVAARAAGIGRVHLYKLLVRHGLR